MLSFISLPSRIIGLLEANISAREIAAGVCLGMFLGLIPLNGPMAALLVIFFFIFKLNRVSTLLTLPLFKAAYLLGASSLLERFGGYLLIDAHFLTGFWRWLTGLPLIALLDFNNTLVCGGFVASAALSVPVYFLAKQAALVAQRSYARGLKNSFVARVASKIKFINKASPKGINKRIYLARLAIVAVALVAAHFGVGLALSPFAGSLIVNLVNKSNAAKISVGKVNVWPLTLSFTLEGLKVFDPERTDQRIAQADKAVCRMSPLALLSGRIVFSSIRLSGASVDIEGAPDGSFNIQNLGRPARAAGGPDDMWKSVSGKKDWFGRIYGVIKDRYAKKNQAAAKARRDAQKGARDVAALPRGRRVRFKYNTYAFEIRDLGIDNGRVKLKAADGQAVDIERVDARLGRVGIDPDKGVKVGLCALRGAVNRAGTPSGSVDLYFERDTEGSVPRLQLRAELKDIDLDAVRFIYYDSLPVNIARGTLTMSSRTSINGDAVNSRDEIVLKNHALEQKIGANPMMGFVPVSAVCDAINRVDPFTLKFSIGGTVEKPEFGGFQESLMALIKPYIANFQENIKNGGLNNAVNSLKALFGNKKE